ncbi:MAG: TolB family protein [Actinomycetota bacterium]
MPDLDERLARRVRAAARPITTPDLFETLDRRRAKRTLRRRVERGALAVAVVVWTVVAVVVATGTFGRDHADEIVIGPAPTGHLAKGAVAVADGDALYEVDVDSGEARRIEGLPRGIWHVSYAPDGSRIAFTVFPMQGPRALWVADADGTGAERIATASNISRASWSPDGAWIAYAADTREGSAIHLVRPDGTQDRPIGPMLTDRDYFSVSFSPDGTSLLFDQGTDVGFGIFAMRIDGTGVRRISDGTRDYDPSLSADGTRIAFTRQEGPMESDIFVMDSDGSNVERLTHGGEGDTNLGPVWAPDGSRIAYTAGVTGGPGPVWLIDPDGGNPALLLEAEILGLAWQPVPVTVTGDVSPTPAGQAGADIGLDFRLCDVQRLGGIDYFGDATSGVAWTGSPVKESGRCSRAFDARHVVAVDLDGDGSADSWTDLPICTGCEPYDATDLGGDGTKELIVLLQYGSTPQYGVFDVVPDGLPRSAGVYPVFVDDPGAPEAGLPPGGPVTLWAGGDEGFAAAIRCEGYPDAPELVVTWSLFSIPDAESDPNATEEFHLTRLRLDEPDAAGASFVVLETTSTTRPHDEDLPFESPARACGVDWEP